MLGFVTKVHQPPCAASDGVSSEVMKSPVVGTSQKIAISASADVDRRPLEEADDPGREPRVGIDGGLDRGLDGGVDGGHQFVSARKRRTLTIRKGMKRIRMKVAIAEPSPKRF